MASTSKNAQQSNLVDYTYHQVYSALTGQREGIRPDHLESVLNGRVEKLRKPYEPYGPPSDASKKAVESKSITLADGFKLSVEEHEKEPAYIISEHFKIDQVDALILLRLLVFNGGLPEVQGTTSDSAFVNELVEKIRPLYYLERLHIPRVLIALLRNIGDRNDSLHKLSKTILPKVIPEPHQFVKDVLAHYVRKSKAPIPDHISENPQSSSKWAKQNAKEQLVLLELVFWLMWDYTPAHASTVLAIFQAAYETEFGYQQENSTAMLDDEGLQLTRDIAAMWILITIEVLNLEDVVENGFELSASTGTDTALHKSPTSMEAIHKLVMNHTSTGYLCTLLAWAFYLKGVTEAASRFPETPPGYADLLKEISFKTAAAYRKGEQELHTTIITACLRPDAGLFSVLHSLLTTSPHFVTAVAWKTGSAVTESNSVAYRAVVRGLLMAVVTYQAVDLIPDYEGLLEAWIALFSSPEVASVASLCRQFWEGDWRHSVARRAIVDVTRSRFPVQYRPLLRLLRAMSGTGSTGFSTDDDATLSGAGTESGLNGDSSICSSYVFHYFRQLPTYTHVLSPQSRTGANAPFDRIIDRSGASSTSGTAYTNLRPMALPGGSVLPQRTIGRLMSSDSSTDPVVVAWQHEHNGWKVVVEVLTDYISRRHGTSRTKRKGVQPTNTRRGDLTVTVHLDEIGMEIEDEEAMIADSLDLLHSIIRGRAGQTHPLMQSLELGGPPVSYTGSDPTPLDLVQLIFMVLEDALTRSQHSKATPSAALVTPALGVLSSLLSQSDYSNRVWLYLRSTSMLFGSDKESNFRSTVLAAERACGQYTMSIAILKLVRSLFEEAVSSLLVTQAQQPKLQEIKDEVLTRALRFVYGQIWVEHSGWRFAHLGERFQMGQHIVAIFSRMLTFSTTLKAINALPNATEYVLRTLVQQTTSSTVNPIAQAIASGKSILVTLTNLRRAGEVRQYVRLLESTLQLTRLMLNEKLSSPKAGTMTVLEQALCSDVTIGGMSIRPQVSRKNPVNVLAQYAREKELGTKIPLEAVLVLSALCVSTAACSPPPPSIISHFSDAEAVMKSFMNIVLHPYDDLSLRHALWSFLAIAVEKQPAISILFVAGQSSRKGKEKESKQPSQVPSPCSSVVEAASQIIANWKNLWETNPQLLASVTNFMDVVWRGSLDHAVPLDSALFNKGFWNDMARIAKEELGPAPDYLTSTQVTTDGEQHSDLHNAVSMHAYRTKTKSHALRIIAAHISMQNRTLKPGAALPAAPDGVKALEPLFTSNDALTEVIAEACSSSFDPELAERVAVVMHATWQPLSLACLQSQVPGHEREFGDNFMVSIPSLLDLLRADLSQPDRFAEAEALQFQAYSVNLNLSLSHAQMLLIEAWRELVECIRPYLRNISSARQVSMSISASMARDVASERRSGDIMCKVHDGRLQLLLAILEIGWFAPSDVGKESEAQVQSFMTLMEHLEAIITSESFPLGKSFLRVVASAFHRPLVRIMYLCARSCHRLSKGGAFHKAERRLTISKTLTTALLLTVDALRLTFDTARTRVDVELDKDMELLVAVFQQSIPVSLYANATAWLTRCQETDVISTSLQLLVQMDIAGYNDIALLRSHKRPLYSTHVLQFHAALASTPFTAERLISENLISAYSNNSLSPALTAGAVSVTVAELLPGERSTAHRSYCNMLANIAGAVAKLGSPVPSAVTLQVAGFVQLYGEQIGKALSWTNDEPLTLPSLDELALTVELFYLLADGATTVVTSKKAQGTDHALSPVLRVFTERALLLLQQVNYALTHPKHLTGLLDPITSDDRVKLEREVANSSVAALSELLDSSNRPLLSRMVRRLLEIATTLLSTLNVLSGAETVLLNDPEEWPTREALVVPHSKVTMGEPASIGTLLELGNCVYETLRLLVNKASSGPGTQGQDAVSVADVAKVRRALESALVYATTQLMMWLAKHDDENVNSGEMDTDDAPQTEGYGQGFGGGFRADASSAPVSQKDFERDRRLKRRSMTLADRLRRGMTGEMTMDLQSLISKAKPVVLKSQDVLGKDTVDVMPILAKFVEERVNS